MTDDENRLEWDYDYEPFGQARVQAKLHPLAPDNSMRFVGEYLDAGTSQYHLRARQYDPGTGRFTSQDPLAPRIQDPFISSYAYANNRPTVMIDPSGLRAKCVLNGVSLGASGVALGATGVALVTVEAPPVAIGAAAVGRVAGFVSAGTGVAATVLECTDGGRFDTACTMGMFMSGINLVTVGTAALPFKIAKIASPSASLAASGVSFSPCV